MVHVYAGQSSLCGCTILITAILQHVITGGNETGISEMIYFQGPIGVQGPEGELGDKGPKVSSKPYLFFDNDGDWS